MNDKKVQITINLIDPLMQETDAKSLLVEFISDMQQHPHLTVKQFKALERLKAHAKIIL